MTSRCSNGVQIKICLTTDSCTNWFVGYVCFTQLIMDEMHEQVSLLNAQLIEILPQLSTSSSSSSSSSSSMKSTNTLTFHTRRTAFSVSEFKLVSLYRTMLLRFTTRLAASHGSIITKASGATILPCTAVLDKQYIHIQTSALPSFHTNNSLVQD